MKDRKRSTVDMQPLLFLYHKYAAHQAWDTAAVAGVRPLGVPRQTDEGTPDIPTTKNNSTRFKRVKSCPEKHTSRQKITVIPSTNTSMSFTRLPRIRNGDHTNVSQFTRVPSRPSVGMAQILKLASGSGREPTPGRSPRIPRKSHDRNIVTLPMCRVNVNAFSMMESQDIQAVQELRGFMAKSTEDYRASNAGKTNASRDNNSADNIEGSAKRADNTQTNDNTLERDNNPGSFDASQTKTANIHNFAVNENEDNIVKYNKRHGNKQFSIHDPQTINREVSDINTYPLPESISTARSGKYVRIPTVNESPQPPSPGPGYTRVSLPSVPSKPTSPQCANVDITASGVRCRVSPRNAIPNNDAQGNDVEKIRSQGNDLQRIQSAMCPPNSPEHWTSTATVYDIRKCRVLAPHRLTLAI